MKKIKVLFLVITFLFFFNASKVLAISSLIIPDDVNFFLDLSPPDFRRNFRVERTLTLSPVVKNYLNRFANNQLHLHFFPEHLVETIVVEDQNGQVLSFSINKSTYNTDLAIDIFPETEKINLYYSGAPYFKERGQVVNFYLYENYLKNIKAPLVFQTQVWLHASGDFSDNDLMFSSLKPSGTETVSSGTKYYFSAQDLATFFQKKRYLWLQFGSRQAFDFNISLDIPAVYDIKFPFSLFARIPVLVSLPTSNLQTFISYHSHPLYARIDDPVTGIQKVVLLVPAAKDQRVEISGQFHFWPLTPENTESLANVYFNSTLADYPDWLFDLYPDDPLFDQNNPLIVSVAQELSSESQKISQIIETTYDYVVSRIDYDYSKMHQVFADQKPLYQSAAETLQKGSGICGDYSILMASLLRAQGIPAQLVFGAVDLVNPTDGLPWHSWVKVNLPENKFIFVDPTWGESGRTYIFDDVEHIPFSYEINSFLFNIADPGMPQSIYDQVKFDYKIVPSKDYTNQYPWFEKKVKRILPVGLFNTQSNYDLQLEDVTFSQWIILAPIILSSPDVVIAIQNHFLVFLVGFLIFCLVIFLFFKLLIRLIKFLLLVIFHKKRKGIR